MISLIENELKKIFSKKSIYITLAITLVFIIACNIIYKVNENNSYGYDLSDNIEYYEQQLEALDVDDPEERSIYISYEVELEISKLVQKYGDSSTWQAQVIYETGRSYIEDKVYAKYGEISSNDMQNLSDQVEQNSSEITDQEYLDKIDISDEAISYIARLSGGDLRYAYNLLEVVYYASDNFKIDLEDVKKINNKPSLYIDKNDDGYYDVISALQKSIRGSDVNAALHYLARLIVAEDLDIIFRRLSVIAYEDIGLANPAIGPRLEAAIKAAERVGLPEARIPLGEIVIDMALSPKSNSAHVAFDNAINDVQMGHVGKVPDHIKTNSKDYKYPHNYKGSYVKQQYLPDELVGRKYYNPKTTSKYEMNLKNIYDRINKA